MVLLLELSQVCRAIVLTRCWEDDTVSHQHDFHTNKKDKLISEIWMYELSCLLSIGS